MARIAGDECNASAWEPGAKVAGGKPSDPPRKSQLADRLEEVADLLEGVGPQHPDRVLFRAAATHALGAPGLLHLVRGGAAALLLATLPTDAVDRLERGETFAVEVCPPPAATSPAIHQPLVEVRVVLGKRHVFVSGAPVKLTNQRTLLLEALLRRGGCTYDEVDHAVWPGHRGDLSRSRYTLVHRLNADLEPHVDAALERAGRPRCKEERLVRCEHGHVFLTVHPSTRV